MTILAIRINSVLGVHKDDEGNIVEDEEFESEFNDAEEEIVWLDSEDALDIDNAISDVKDILFKWDAPNVQEPEANEVS